VLETFADHINDIAALGFLVVEESSAENVDPTVVGVLADRDIITAIVAKEAGRACLA
jgi:hypothetical protein